MIVLTERSNGRRSLTSLMRESRIEDAPTIMVTTRVTPMTIEVPVAEVRPGLRTAFSRAIRASIPGHRRPKSLVRVGTITVQISRIPMRHAMDIQKDRANFCVALLIFKAARRHPPPTTARKRPTTRVRRRAAREEASASFTGERAAIGGT